MFKPKESASGTITTASPASSTNQVFRLVKAVVFAFSEHRMHLGIVQVNLPLLSVFTVFASDDVSSCKATSGGGRAGAESLLSSTKP